jgi:hypothetical protein
MVVMSVVVIVCLVGLFPFVLTVSVFATSATVFLVFSFATVREFVFMNVLFIVFIFVFHKINPPIIKIFKKI